MGGAGVVSFFGSYYSSLWSCNGLKHTEVITKRRKMKYLFIILIVAISSCTKEKEASIILDKPFTLAPGDKGCLSSQNVCITFEKVNSDSRCPSTAICVWQGVAEAAFLLKINESTYPFTLHTTDELQYQRDTIIQGYTIKLELLSPYPDGKPIKQNAYRAQIRISK
jgi:hypothetical protein